MSEETVVDEPAAQKPPHKLWRQLGWSDGLGKVSAAAVALAAISGAAVTFKDNLFELLGIKSAPIEDVTNEVSGHGDQSAQLNPIAPPDGGSTRPSPGRTEGGFVIDDGRGNQLEVEGSAIVRREGARIHVTPLETCRPGEYRGADRRCSRLPPAPEPPPVPPAVVIPPPQMVIRLPVGTNVDCPNGQTLPPGSICPIPGPFVVFFDWDRAQITLQAAAILDNAAEQYRTTGNAQVVLAGHADRSGSDRYNVGLSQRRAENVRQHLAGRGIAEGVLRTVALGESSPAVQTADGVREPQNRRVEITLGPGSGW